MRTTLCILLTAMATTACAGSYDGQPLLLDENEQQLVVNRLTNAANMLGDGAPTEDVAEAFPELEVTREPPRHSVRPSKFTPPEPVDNPSLPGVNPVLDPDSSQNDP